jgi:hypothetical protein
MNSPTDVTPYDDLIHEESRRSGVPVNYIKSTIFIESAGDPNAQSEVGAQGLMQLMPDTQQQMGVQDPFDPAQNIRGGVNYIKPLYDKYGPVGGYGAYHMGPSGYAQALEGQRPIGPNTQTAMDRMQQHYQPAPAGGAPGQQTVMQANPSLYRDPFDPNANMQLPGQPIYEQAPQGPPAPQPQGAFPPMGGTEAGIPQFDIGTGMGPQDFRQGAGQPQGPGEADAASPQGPGDLANPRGPEDPTQGQGEAPGVQTQYEPPQGSINIPSPEANPGFWETIRNAAQNDPGTFYMVLADMARLNLDGIKQTMQQREGNLLARAELQAKEGAKFATDANKKIDQIRMRAASAGYLDSWEEEHGIVDTTEEAEALQAHWSQGRAKERSTKEYASSVNNLQKLVGQLVKNPNMAIPQNIPWIKEVYGEGPEAERFLGSLGEAREEMKADKLKKQAMMDQRMEVMQENLRLAKARQKDAQAQQQISLISRQTQALESNLKKNYDTWREMHWARRFGLLDETQESEYQRLTQAIQQAELDLEHYKYAIEQFVQPQIDDPGYGNTGEAGQGTGGGGGGAGGATETPTKVRANDKVLTELEGMLDDYAMPEGPSDVKETP